MTTAVKTVPPMGGLVTELLPHQAECLAWLLQHPRALLADWTGLGKTVEALALYAALRLQRGKVRTLVITEAALVNQWCRESSRHLSGVYAAPLDQHLTAGAADIKVSSYALAMARDEAPDYDLVILDEASYFRTGPTPYVDAGKTWHWIQRFTRDVPHVVAMTATSVENHPFDAYSILSAMNVRGLPTLMDFAKAFEWTTGYKDGRKWIPSTPLGFASPEAEAWVAAHLNAATLRRTADDVDLGLPVRVGESVRLVPLTGAQEALYDRHRGTKGLFGHHKRQQAGRAAGESSSLVDAAVEEIAQRAEKVIAYAENLAQLDRLAAALMVRGITFCRIDGQMTQPKRQKALAAFADPDGPQVLLGNEVLERGLNLQHCRVLISLDPSFNPAREVQREGRVCRIGSPHSTYEHLTLVPDTPDGRARLARLDGKRQLAGAVGL